MSNRSERASSTIVLDPDIAVGPGNDAARYVVRVHKEHWIIVDHFVNVTVPGGDVNDAVAVCPQAGHGDSPAQCWPVLPARPIPFEKAILRSPNPDITLSVGQHPVHLIRRVVQYLSLIHISEPT